MKTMKQYASYRQLWQALLPYYDEREAQAVVRMMLEERFGLTLTDIVCGGVARLDASQQAELQGMMAKLEQGEPIQYVMGYAPFCGRHFHVEPGVLIPRPETQQLVEWAVEEMGKNAARSVLDIGTGSGCIAISIALEAPLSEVSAWDISTDALRIARGNAASLHAVVDFRQQDALYAPMEDREKWDLIISNPPYVMEKERKEMADNVLRHEPSLALFVPNDDPLRFYRAIARYGKHALRPGGTLLFEINPLLAEDMLRLLEEESYQHVQLIADAFGKSRFTKATI